MDSLLSKLMIESCDIFSQARLTKKTISVHERRLRNALVQADVSFPAAKSVASAAVRLAAERSASNDQNLSSAFVNLLKDLLSRPVPERPLEGVLLMVGPNGAGKTTTTAKLAKRLSRRGSTAVVACDICRPAAREQLQKMVEGGDVKFYAVDPKSPRLSLSGMLPELKKFRAVLLDTSGKQDNADADFEELSWISSEVSPDWTLLVCDASGGQQVSSLAKFFLPLGIDAAVLTKMDGDALGGAAISIIWEIDRPILFCGTGERVDDLDMFDPVRMAGRIMGKGDLATLAERAAREESIAALPVGRLDFNSMLSITCAIRGMGGLSWVTKMLPKNFVCGAGDASSGMARIEAMIMSMTTEERSKPYLFEDPSRISRVALGSGQDEGAVRELIGRLDMLNAAGLPGENTDD